MKEAKVIAISNQKGGVGKTTSSINISAELARAGFRVLLVDFDPQGSATSGLGIKRIPGKDFQPTRHHDKPDLRFRDITVGMRAVHVPHSEIPGTQRGHTEGQPDAVVASLLDLLEHLDRWS